MTTPPQLARDRGVREILHYTSQKGVMGSIIVDALLSRKQVEETPAVEFIFEGVWDRYRDPRWVDHISLSVSQINLDLFERSRRRHPDWWWAVMSFDPTLLADNDVWFTTTNNIFPSCRRNPGLAGFEAIFAERVEGRFQRIYDRTELALAPNLPTDLAAEVLYPQRIALDRLQRLYLPGEQHRRTVNAWCEVYGRDELPVEIGAGVFS